MTMTGKLFLFAIFLRVLSVIMPGCLLLVALIELLPGTGSTLQLAYITQGLRGNLPIMEIHLLDLEHHTSLRLAQLEDQFIVPYGANGILWWSPDGSSLAFMTDNRRQSMRQLHVITLINQGTGDRIIAQLTNQLHWITLDWSPDSRSIAYTTRQQTTHRDTFKVMLDSETDPDPAISAVVQSENAEYGGMWSPDGAYFAYLGGADNNEDVNLYLQSLTVPDAQPIALTQPPLTISQPRWSPDSTWLVFTGQMVSESRPRGNLYRVNVMQPNAKPELLTQGSGASYAAVWSPDGAKLAYLTNTPGYISLSLLDLNTMETRTLTDNHFSAVTAPAWSPDGTLIAFSATERGRGASLYLINADGTNLTQLIDAPFDELSPVWRPKR